MDNTALKRLSSVAVLSLLSLLAIAIGAQVALAEASSSTPAAGTQGRGGVSAASSSAVAGLDPAAGTAGRGGVAALAGPATLAGETTVANNGFSLRARGGVPRPVAGTVAAPSAASATVDFGVWVAVGVAAAAGCC